MGVDSRNRRYGMPARDWRVSGMNLEISSAKLAAKIALQEAIRLDKPISFWNVHETETRTVTPEGKLLG